MCGLRLPPNAKVCEFCGYDVDEDEDEWVSEIEKIEQEIVSNKPASEESSVDRMIDSTIRKSQLKEPEKGFEPLPIPPPPSPEPTNKSLDGAKKRPADIAIDGPKCPICDARIHAGQKYCPNCGADFDEEAFTEGSVEPKAGLKGKTEKGEAADTEKTPIAPVMVSWLEEPKEKGIPAKPRPPVPQGAAATVAQKSRATPEAVPKEKSEQRTPAASEEPRLVLAERKPTSSMEATKADPDKKSVRVVRKVQERPAQPNKTPSLAELIQTDSKERAPQLKIATAPTRIAKAEPQERPYSAKQGRVNGTRQGRVNGTERGKVNGLKKQVKPPEHETKPSWMKTKVVGRFPMWQLLAAMVVLILVISSAYVITSMPSGKEGIKIDGYFTDWASVPSYQFSQVVPGTLQGIDEGKISFKMDIGSVSKLYVYMKLQDGFFADSEASTIYVFIDADEDAATGYRIDDSIGADILAVLSGWNGSLEEASEIKYSSMQDQSDWNSYVSTSGFPHSVSANEIEMSIDVTIANPLVRIVTSVGEIESRGPLMSPGGTILVKQEPLMSGSITSAATTPVLRVSLRAMGVTGQQDAVVCPSLLNGTGAKTVAENISVSSTGWTTRDLTADLSSCAMGEGFTYSFSGTAGEFDGAIDVVGKSSCGYYLTAPTMICVDGVFGDWAGRNLSDVDPAPVANPNIDISEYGAATQSNSYYMYVGTVGDALGGADVPEKRIKSSQGGQGGGSVVKIKKTGEDLLQAFIDVDPMSGIGKTVVAGSASIEADYLVEIYGRDGKVTSSSVKEWSVASVKWISAGGIERAGVGTHGIEFSINKTLLGNLTDSEIIFFTTDWKARSDNCLLDASLSDPWVIGDAPAMSYRSNDGIAWTSTGSISLEAGDQIVAIAHSLDRTYVFAVTNTGRVYDWEVNVDSSWGPDVTGPCNSTEIVGLAPNSASGEGGCLILGANGWTWSTSTLGGARGWSNGTSKVAQGADDFADVCYNATGSRYWAIRSGADTSAYYREPSQEWNATSSTGSAATQMHLVNIGDGAATPANERIFVLCEDGSIRYSGDGGANWASRGDLPAPGNDGLPAYSRYVAIDRDSNGILWAITNTSFSYCSTDLGLSWTYTGNISADNIVSLACPIPYIPEFDSILIPIAGAFICAMSIMRVRRRKRTA